ncbi:DUF4343 domain-containing protein [Paenibacillaceae bacterium]|nr:DUF4343 domain-containing protein [Paenibacillaceae bacterium]
MADFLIQTINGQVKHDMFEHDYSNYTPSGTIEFIRKYLSNYHDIHSEIKPINIPAELWSFEYLKRMPILLEKHSEYFPKEDVFVKSNNKVKGYTGIIHGSKREHIPEGEYIVSRIMNIESEWRGFVHNGKLVGIQNYSGDFTKMPDINLINKMIRNYTYSPAAYTIDVGLNDIEGTFLIEIHCLFSCGFYGFSESRIIPQMILRGFQSLLKSSSMSNHAIS